MGKRNILNLVILAVSIFALVLSCACHDIGTPGGEINSDAVPSNGVKSDADEKPPVDPESKIPSDVAGNRAYATDLFKRFCENSENDKNEDARITGTMDIVLKNYNTETKFTAEFNQVMSIVNGDNVYFSSYSNMNMGTAGTVLQTNVYCDGRYYESNPYRKIVCEMTQTQINDYIEENNDISFIDELEPEDFSSVAVIYENGKYVISLSGISDDAKDDVSKSLNNAFGELTDGCELSQISGSFYCLPSGVLDRVYVDVIFSNVEDKNISVKFSFDFAKETLNSLEKTLPENADSFVSVPNITVLSDIDDVFERLANKKKIDMTTKSQVSAGGEAGYLQEADVSICFDGENENDIKMIYNFYSDEAAYTAVYKNNSMIVIYSNGNSDDNTSYGKEDLFAILDSCRNIPISSDMFPYFEVKKSGGITEVIVTLKDNDWIVFKDTYDTMFDGVEFSIDSFSAVYHIRYDDNHDLISMDSDVSITVTAQGQTESSRAVSQITVNPYGTTTESFGGKNA